MLEFPKRADKGSDAAGAGRAAQFVSELPDLIHGALLDRRADQVYDFLRLVHEVPCNLPQHFLLAVGDFR